MVSCKTVRGISVVLLSLVALSTVTDAFVVVAPTGGDGFVAMKPRTWALTSTSACNNRRHKNTSNTSDNRSGARHARTQRSGSCLLGMKMDVGPGSYVALVTPMTPDGQVDENALRGLLRWHVESGTDGIVALGTTGEASVLSHAERQRVLEITVEEAGQVLPIVAGTSSVNPQVVIEQSNQAAELGADAVLVVTPAYVKPSQKGLLKFYQAIADEGALPVVLYNVPSRTAVDMHTRTVAELARHPRILGLKDATGDLSRVDALRESCPKDFLLYSGDDETGMDFVLGGGHGVISVTADVVPREISDIIKASRAGDRRTAEAINNKVIQLHTKLFVQGNPVTVKYALSRMGRIFNSLRVPLVPMEDQFKAEVDLALESAGLLAPSVPSREVDVNLGV